MSKPKSGSCLCKAVQFEIQADTEPIYNVICHCENCKKTSGSQMFCASIFPKEAFSVRKGQPKRYADHQTDSGQPLYRHFCDTCGSSLFALTPCYDEIVSVFSGAIDGVEKWWVPNKEQYLVTKSHWLPDFVLEPKDGVPAAHQRGPIVPDKDESKGEGGDGRCI